MDKNELISHLVPKAAVAKKGRHLYSDKLNDAQGKFVSSSQTLPTLGWQQFALTQIVSYCVVSKLNVREFRLLTLDDINLAQRRIKGHCTRPPATGFLCPHKVFAAQPEQVCEKCTEFSSPSYLLRSRELRYRLS